MWKLSVQHLILENLNSSDCLIAFVNISLSKCSMNFSESVDRISHAIRSVKHMLKYWIIGYYL